MPFLTCSTRHRCPPWNLIYSAYLPPGYGYRSPSLHCTYLPLVRMYVAGGMLHTHTYTHCIAPHSTEATIRALLPSSHGVPVVLLPTLSRLPDHLTPRYPGQPYISLPYIHLQRHSSASHPGKPRTHAATATARATAPSSSSGCVAVCSVDT